ncbi:MAG: efflux RND transporter periplasmic adaptor subunit [Bernardetiaceae bacterium]
MSRSKKLLFPVLAIIVILLGGLAIARWQGWIGGKRALAVNWETIQRKTITEKVSASGRIQPETEVEIAPDVSGEITGLFVREGDSVPQGKLLLRIRPDNYETAVERARAGLDAQRANLAQAKSRLAQSKAQYLRAKADYERNKQLFEQKIVAEQEFLNFKTNYEVAESEWNAAQSAVEASRYTVQSSEATLNEARKNLELTEVYAPRSGIVSQLNVEEGERVVGTVQMAGTPMLRIANLSDMEVLVDVNENDIIRVSLRDTAIVEVDAYPGKQFKGIVTSIANTAKQNALGSDAVTEFEVKIRILRSSYEEIITQARPYPFRPGMTASVEVLTNRKENVLAVPLAAVTTRNKNEADNQEQDKNEELQEVVFVKNEDNTAQKIVVKTGISDFENIEILEGLTEGQAVITGPFRAISQQLEDGKAVEKLAAKKKDRKR